MQRKLANPAHFSRHRALVLAVSCVMAAPSLFPSPERIWVTRGEGEEGEEGLEEGGELLR